MLEVARPISSARSGAEGVRPADAVHVAVNGQLISAEPGFRQAGVSRYIVELLNAMWQLSAEGSGPRWTVCCPPGVDATTFPVVPPASVRLRRSVLPTAHPVVRIAWEQLLSPAVMLANRPDVLLCPLNVVPLAVSCPTVVVVHDLAFLRLNTHRRTKQSYLKAMTRASVSRARHVIAVSEFTRQELIEMLGVPESKVTAIPNGRGSAFVPQEAGSVRAFRERRSLPERFLLFVGTLEPRKNLDGLLRAYAGVAERLGVSLVVVGGRGWRYSGSFDLVGTLGLEGRVRFEDFVPDEELPLYYAAAVALVYPSLYEGFGLPPLEAMGTGTPVITTRGSSLSDVVGRAGLLVDAGDEAALAEAMVRVTEDGELRRDLRQAGLDRAALFSWDRAAAGTLDVLMSVAQG